MHINRHYLTHFYILNLTLKDSVPFLLLCLETYIKSFRRLRSKKDELSQSKIDFVACLILCSNCQLQILGFWIMPSYVKHEKFDRLGSRPTTTSCYNLMQDHLSYYGSSNVYPHPPLSTTNIKGIIMPPLKTSIKFHRSTHN